MRLRRIHRRLRVSVFFRRGRLTVATAGFDSPGTDTFYARRQRIPEDEGLK
jgi:hypothetical protein